MTDAEHRELGLRERKRLATMNRIQQVALELFDRYGYAQVPIERIAAAADVSPSSVYRYFGTKEQIVLWDEYDPIAIERMAAELKQRPAIGAVRAVLAEMFALMLREQGEQRVRRRIHYMVREPAIAAAAAVQAHQLAEVLVGRLAEGIPRPPDELDLYVMAHGFVGAVIGAMRYWYAIQFAEPLPEILDRVVTTFESGIPFDSRADPRDATPPAR